MAGIQMAGFMSDNHDENNIHSSFPAPQHPDGSDASGYTMERNGTDDPQGWAGVGSTMAIGAGPGSYSMPRVGPTSAYGKVTK